MQKYVRVHLLLINYLVCCVGAYYVNDLKLGNTNFPISVRKLHVLTWGRRFIGKIQSSGMESSSLSVLYFVHLSEFMKHYMLTINAKYEIEL